VVQQNTGRPVQFGLMDDARASLLKWLELRGGSLEDYAFPRRTDHAAHISTRQYARLVDEWVTGIGLPTTSGRSCSFLMCLEADIRATVISGFRLFAASAGRIVADVNQFSQRCRSFRGTNVLSFCFWIVSVRSKSERLGGRVVNSGQSCTIVWMLRAPLGATLPFSR
jgi:hypothetical protein